ncbi:hypothetical protein DL770_001286 [Monosporascus sp. CRB-9-2]|nr:hypothetical protein DL770_001286 [Monosporascus sp. CRB-9-2]
MRLINVKTSKFEEFPDHRAPSYAILSHTWGSDVEELTFRDVEKGKTKNPGVGSVKLQGCCQQAMKDRVGYIWIDTCCIDRTNLVELSEAINSMFRWYQRASVCYAYLSDVPGDQNPREEGSKFRTSRWFRRGWTLQELLAPRRVVFYNSEWHRLGAKAQLRTVIEEITGIPQRFLTGGSNVESASVAQRMSWAAPRQTTRKEDLAYCLLGLFGIAMPMIYGEGGDRAFFRLQEQIMRSTRDHSILAWGLGEFTGDSAQSQAGGFLAAAPFDFARSGDIVPRDQRAAYLDLLEISGGSLRVSLSLLTTSTETIGLLNCGPEGNAQQVVGIPLAKVASGSANEYIRPRGRRSVLLLSTSSDAPREPIYIKNENGPTTQILDQPGWAYDDGDFADVDLELIDVVPRSSWHEGRSVIIPTTESDGSTVSPTLVRLRHDKEGSRDFILMLELKQQDTHHEAHHCVAICSRDTTSEELAGKLRRVIQKAAGRKTASNGLLNLQLVLKPSAGQSMFTIRPKTLLHPPDVTVDATIELLLEEGADVIEDKDARTAISYAVRGGREAPVHLLLRNGATSSIDPATAAWQLRQTLEGHTGSVQSVAFSHDSKLLASGSWDSTIRLWDPATGQLQQTLGGHTGSVASVAFSHDSKLLASGSSDSTIRLWDPATGQLRQTFEGHTSLVQSVAFSHDSKLLASGSHDKTIRLWDPDVNA